MSRQRCIASLPITLVVPLAAMLGCGKLESAAEAPAMMEEQDARSSMGPGGAAPITAAEPARDEAPKKLKGKADKRAPSKPMPPSEPADEGAKGELADPELVAAPTPTRAWFPETMLFAPRVITDDSGSASLDVPVPDRLTTWRVLALAHSRQGAQAGSLSSFTSNLPVSVDVVVPPFLVAGDRVALPIQVVNSTDAALARTLTTRVDGGRLSGAPASVRVAARGTSTVTAWLDATAPGIIAVEATVPGEDSVARSIPVKSAGQPFHVERGGTLAAPRAISMALPAGVLDGSARVTLTVLPGALALLRAELAAAPGRASVDDDAFLLALTGRAPALAAKLNTTFDADTLKRLSRLAGQRLARQALNPDLFAALKLAPGALQHAPDTLIGRNGAHLAGVVARAQRPDGTFGGGSGWSAQRVLVTTADGLAVLRAGTDAKAARAATLRARGAFERFAGQIDDPYTAAAVLATGALEGALADELTKRVTDAIVARDDGARALPVPGGAMRADGSSPTEIEATALAVLALYNRPAAGALLPDLGATLLGAYRPGAGFGDGATNSKAIEAIALLFTDPLPTRVTVSLSVDGKAIATETLEGDKLKQQATMSAALARPGEKLALSVAADPPVPGLSYLAAIDGAVPWPAPPPDAGLALEVEAPALIVGSSATLTLRATAPGGSALRIEHALPAGVDPVKASLQALVEADTIDSFEIAEGKVTLVAPEREQGSAFTARYAVIPSLAGSLQPTASSAELAGDQSTRVYFPPRPWRISAR